MQIHVLDREKLNMTAVQVSILDALLRLFPEMDIFVRAKPDGIDSFDKAVGSSKLRLELCSRMSVEEILRDLDRGRAPFMVERMKYLLYN